MGWFSTFIVGLVLVTFSITAVALTVVTALVIAEAVGLAYLVLKSD